MHCSSPFSSLWVCVWLSFFFLFLSFLPMAPKKSIPSRNPISHRGSSSSSSFPFRDRFHDPKSQKDFEENFCNRAIHSKRHVVLFDFLDTLLLGVFNSWDWESLWEKPSRSPSVCIKESYSNIHAINISIPQFTMVFKGTCIVLTSKLISNVLCVPRVAHSDYPSAPHFHSISQDELASHFCEKPILWGNTLNCTTHDFANGLRILNIVMAFVLTLRSHYNTIT